METTVVPMAMQVVGIDNPELVSQGEALTSKAGTLVVVDDATFQQAAESRRNLAAWIKEAHEFFDPICDSQYKAWKVSTERRKLVIEPKETAYKALGATMADFNQQRERERRAAEEVAQRERERLEAEAEAAAKAEEVRLRNAAEDAQLAEAITAEQAGDTETAARILETPVVVPPVAPAPVFVPPVQVTTPKATGSSFSSTWSASLMSMQQLVIAAASGHTVALSCLKFDEVRANGLARSLKHAMKDGKAVPGVTSVETRTTTTRTP